MAFLNLPAFSGSIILYLVWWDVIGYDSWHIMAFRLDTNGGLIIVWQIYENFINNEFYAQRINRDGNKGWDEAGVSLCNAPDIQKRFSRK